MVDRDENPITKFGNTSVYTSLAYLIGTLFTYRHTLNSMLIDSGSRESTVHIVKAVALAFIWPLYWAYRALGS